MNDEASTASNVESGGPVDGRVPSHQLLELERPIVYTLMAPGWLPPGDLVTQAYGICFTPSGSVVVVEKHGGYRSLPGGQVESGEHVVEALRRELAEEACARLVAYRYLACQHVWDPDAPSGPRSHYQTRWWARVELDPWVSRYEMASRLLVAREDVVEQLSWEDKTIATVLLADAIEVEATFDRSL